MSLTSRRTAMARKRYKPEEIVAKLRQVDVLVSQGQTMVDAIRQIGVSEVTYYRWRHRSHAVVTTRSVSPPILSSLPGNTAAMAIARSPNCCARRAGQSTTSGSSVSGNVRG